MLPYAILTPRCFDAQDDPSPASADPKWLWALPDVSYNQCSLKCKELGQWGCSAISYGGKACPETAVNPRVHPKRGSCWCFVHQQCISAPATTEQQRRRRLDSSLPYKQECFDEAKFATMVSVWGDNRTGTDVGTMAPYNNGDEGFKVPKGPERTEELSYAKPDYSGCLLMDPAAASLPAPGIVWVVHDDGSRSKIDFLPPGCEADRVEGCCKSAVANATELVNSGSPDGEQLPVRAARNRLERRFAACTVARCLCHKTRLTAIFPPGFGFGRCSVAASRRHRTERLGPTRCFTRRCSRIGQRWPARGTRRARVIAPSRRSGSRTA